MKKTPKEKKRRNKLKHLDRKITVKEIYGKDRGVCGICFLPVPLNRKPNDPLSPSRDHVEPLSEGGKNRTANIRLAHRMCNSERDITDPSSLRLRIIQFIRENEIKTIVIPDGSGSTVVVTADDLERLGAAFNGIETAEIKGHVSSDG